MRVHSALARLTLLTGLIVTAILPAVASAACPDESIPSAQQSEAGMSQSILCLINEERAAAGIGPVAFSKPLGAAASVHSNDMVARGYFAHRSPTGADFVDRIANTGYLRGERGWVAGENIAWGTGSLSTPAELVQAWMESPPHRENLLNEALPRHRNRDHHAVLPEPASDSTGVTVTSEYGYLFPKQGDDEARKAREVQEVPRRGADALDQPLTRRVSLPQVEV